MAEQNFFEKLGPGTLMGVAVGGVGALASVLFMGWGKNEGEGPGILTSILTFIVGVVGGGLVGGYVKQDGPLFTPQDKAAPAPDGTAVVKRGIGLDKPPSGAKGVELDYAKTIHDFVAKDPQATERFKPIDAMIQEAAKQYRFVLQTGEEKPGAVTFTGAFLPDGKEPVKFEKPVELPVSEGKVDYMLAGGLSMMRMAEQNNLAAALTLPDLDGLKAQASTSLDEKEQKHLHGMLELSALAANSKISAQLARDIHMQAVNSDGTLNMEFLEKNKQALGLDKEHVVMFAPDGDNLNLATGTRTDKNTIAIEQSMVVDVKTFVAKARNGNLMDGIANLIVPGTKGLQSEIDLSRLDAMNAGIRYRKPVGHVEIDAAAGTSLPSAGGREMQMLDIGEFNKAIEKVNAGPETPPAPGQSISVKMDKTITAINGSLDPAHSAQAQTAIVQDAAQPNISYRFTVESITDSREPVKEYLVTQMKREDELKHTKNDKLSSTDSMSRERPVVSLTPQQFDDLQKGGDTAKALMNTANLRFGEKPAYDGIQPLGIPADYDAKNPPKPVTRYAMLNNKTEENTVYVAEEFVGQMPPGTPKLQDVLKFRGEEAKDKKSFHAEQIVFGSGETKPVDFTLPMKEAGVIDKEAADKYLQSDKGKQVIDEAKKSAGLASAAPALSDAMARAYNLFALPRASSRPEIGAPSFFG